jgi:ankyrin repeat protein/cell wall assembly regulator SMI1
MGIQIRHSLEQLTTDQLAALEGRLGVALPEDYRTFLLQHNGGIPRPNWFRSPELGEVLWLLSVGRAGILDPMRLDLEAAVAKLRAPGSTLPGRLVPVAEVWTFSNPGILSDYLCLSIEGADRGELFFWRDIEHYRLKAPLKAANSWSAFLAGLYHRDGEPPKWLLMIQDGDLTGLQRWLAEGGSLKVTDSNTWSPLDHALREGRWEIVQWLIDRGASPTRAFEDALDQRRYPLARRLLSHGIKPRVIQQALTPPWHEFFWRDLELPRALIDAGADVNHVDKQISDRNTPLHFAADVGAVEAVRLLLEHGARPDVKNGDGKSPQKLAEDAGHAEVAKLLAEARPKPRPAKPQPVPAEAVKELDLHGVKIRRSGPAVTTAQLAALESKLGIRLPEDYRGFLLRHNGGVPRPNKFRYAVDDADEGAQGLATATVTRLYPATSGEGAAAGAESLETAYQPSSDWSPPAGLLPIGYVDDDLSGGSLCLSVTGKDCGQVYYAIALEDQETLYEVAPSFEALLALLGKHQARQPAWVTAIQDGDLPAVQKWLDEGGSLASEFRQRQPLALAVAEGQLEIVKLLLERGAPASEAFLHAMDSARNVILRYLLASGAVRTVEKDAFVSYQGPGWQSALWNDEELVRALVDAGADVDFRCEDGTTPLYLAAQYGSPAVVQFLLQRGAKAGIWNHNMGQTALHRAVFTEDREQLVAKMKLLIDAGEHLHAQQPRQMPFPPQQLPDHVLQALGAFGGGLQQMLAAMKRQLLRPEPSAAELLAQYKGKAVLQEVEAYAASRAR